MSRACLTIAVSLMLLSCSPEQPPAVEEDAPAEGVVPTLVVAGEQLDFPCNKTVSIWPSQGLLGHGQRYLALKAGHYEWRCSEGGRRGELEVKAAPMLLAIWDDPHHSIRLGAAVNTTARALDLFGNVSEQTLEVRVEPADALLEDRGRLRAVIPGDVWLSASPAPGLEVRRRIRVDTGPPELRIDLPVRGTVVRPGLTQALIVAGQVSDDTAVSLLELDGQPIQLDAEGNFKFSLPLQGSGLKLLRFRASDELGQETRATRSVMYGPLRQPKDGLQTAARVFLPKDLLDDNSADLDDLATAVEMLIGWVRLPRQNIRYGCEVSAVLENISLRAEKVDIIPANGKLEVDVQLADVHVDVSGELCLCGFDTQILCGSSSGYLSTARIRVSATAQLGTNGPTSLHFENLELELEPLDIHWSFLDGKLDWVIAIAEEQIRTRLLKVLTDTIAERLDFNLSSILAGVLPLQTIHLPEPLDADVAVKTELAALSATDFGLLVDLDAELDTHRKGAIARNAIKVATEPPTLSNEHVGVALSLDLLNDAMFSLFVDGALEEVPLLLDELGVSVPAGLDGPIFISATLPPMLLAGHEPGMLRLIVADLKIRVETAVEPFVIFVSLQIPAKLSFDQERSEVVLSLVPELLQLDFEPATPEDAQSLAGSFDNAGEILQRVVLSTLASEPIRIPIPVLDMSKLPAMPPTARLNLFDAGLSVTSGGYLVAEGKIKLSMW
ncbi:MAG: hypothetical protein RBU37_14425 [Myxococcota bacterium]|nr:hypothetical protein [Myxococcota bacterium]